MRAAIYARYSSDAQSEQSIEDQVRICRARADREGWTVVDVYADYAISGASAGRPRYQQLIADARAGAFEVIVAEALDRISRDQEHIAGFHKQVSFARVRVVTIAEGDISELHVGLKGTMSALFLKDLAQKTHRGLEGRVRAGRSGGGLCYGYKAVRGPVGHDGEAERGLREIVPEQARVVERIFREYAAGMAPRQIALRLNAEDVAGPSGGAWGPSAINGDRGKGTGILNNELYIGRLVWNRRRWLKDPATGKRLARRNDASAVVTEEVPALRIIDDALWQAVKQRQAVLDARCSKPGSTPQSRFWTKQRPRHLFSGLMGCSVCGGGFSKISASHFGCSTARNKGPTACTNLLTVRVDRLENTVLGALKERLMDPELFKVFVEEFTAEWNRLQAEASAGRHAKEQQVARIRQQLERLVDALAEGTPAAMVKDRMAALEAQQRALEAELAAMTSPAPRLHPSLAEVYRERVASLAEALNSDDGLEARDIVRGLVEQIRLVPEDGRLRIEVRGALGAILALAEGARNAERPGDVARAFGVQIKMDAGTRSRRCQYISVTV